MKIRVDDNVHLFLFVFLLSPRHLGDHPNHRARADNLRVPSSAQTTAFVHTRRVPKAAATAGYRKVAPTSSRHTYPKVLKTSSNNRGTAKLRQHPPPYVPEGSQNQPPPRGHRGVAPTTALSTQRFSSCRLLPRRENRRFTSSVCETDWRVPRS